VFFYRDTKISFKPDNSNLSFAEAIVKKWLSRCIFISGWHFTGYAKAKFVPVFLFLGIGG
jgi:hypothetical protein